MFFYFSFCSVVALTWEKCQMLRGSCALLINVRKFYYEGILCLKLVIVLNTVCIIGDRSFTLRFR